MAAEVYAVGTDGMAKGHTVVDDEYRPTGMA